MCIREFLSGLRIKVIFAEEQKIYILNPTKEYIIFYLDLKDSCIYINRDVLDRFGYKVIGDFLMDYKMDIFPYDPTFSKADIESIETVDCEYLSNLSESIAYIVMGEDSSVNAVNIKKHNLIIIDNPIIFTFEFLGCDVKHKSLHRYNVNDLTFF